MKNVLHAWCTTNLGGRNFVFASRYKGGLPVFYTKKEAVAHANNLSEHDRLKIERGIVPGRRVVRCTITYEI